MRTGRSASRALGLCANPRSFRGGTRYMYRLRRHKHGEDDDLIVS